MIPPDEEPRCVHCGETVPECACAECDGYGCRSCPTHAAMLADGRDDGYGDDDYRFGDSGVA